MFFLEIRHELFIGGVRQVRCPLCSLFGVQNVNVVLLEDRQIVQTDRSNVIERGRFVETQLVELGEELGAPAARIEHHNAVRLGGRDFLKITLLTDTHPSFPAVNVRPVFSNSCFRPGRMASIRSPQTAAKSMSFMSCTPPEMMT